MDVKKKQQVLPSTGSFFLRNEQECLFSVALAGSALFPIQLHGDLGIFRALTGVLIFVEVLAQSSLQVSYLVKNFSFSSLHSLLSAGRAVKATALFGFEKCPQSLCKLHERKGMTSPLLGSFASLLESELKTASTGQEGEYQDSSWSIQPIDLHRKDLQVGSGSLSNILRVTQHYSNHMSAATTLSMSL